MLQELTRARRKKRDRAEERVGSGRNYPYGVDKGESSVIRL
jgi:hypothetical protein